MEDFAQVCVVPPRLDRDLGEASLDGVPGIAGEVIDGNLRRLRHPHERLLERARHPQALKRPVALELHNLAPALPPPFFERAERDDDAPQERTVRRGAFLFRGHHSPASRIASPSVSIGSPSVNGDSSPSGNHRTLSVSPGASSSPGLPRERATTMFSPLKASP